MFLAQCLAVSGVAVKGVPWSQTCGGTPLQHSSRRTEEGSELQWEELQQTHAESKAPAIT